MKKIFLGPPGSGKGTAASRIAPKFEIPHISTGELFRENIKNKTPIGLKAQKFMEKGELVPDEIVIEMLKERLAKDDCKKGFILDGFPRTILQAEMLQKLTDIKIVVNMNVTDDVIIKRLSSRVCCSKCGEVYNLIGLPTKQKGICDKCKGEVIRRKDDEPEVIKDRLKIYQEQTQPLINFYKEKGILVDVLCNDFNQTVQETFQQTLKAIEDFLGKKSEEN